MKLEENAIMTMAMEGRMPFRCDNCGHYQHTTEFGECEECGYEDLVPISEEEYDLNTRFKNSTYS